MTADHQVEIGTKVRVAGQLGEVVRAERRGEATLYRVAFAEGPPKSFLVPPTQIERVSSPLELVSSLSFDDPARFDLLTEATRLSLAYEYDRLLSLAATRTNLEPYQVDAVYQVLNGYKQRFLIADDVGLGKTIEAGMILKELAARGRANRVLVVVPAALQYQWQREMRERFDDHYVIYNSAYLKQLRQALPKDANAWEAHDKIITSLDYAKRQDGPIPELLRTEWDVIVFDEAHKLSISRYGNKVQRTQRYRLGQALYDRTDALLLLTATPHKGDPFAFHGLIVLLDPYMFEDPDSVEPERLATIMIRRGKDGIKDPNGEPVFRPREVRTVPVTFTPAEEKLYDEVTEYVRHEYNMARSLEQRAVGFAMILLQKRMVSSIAAIRRSLTNRAARLLAGTGGEFTREEERLVMEYMDDADALTDYEKEYIEGKLETVTAQSTSVGLEAEIARLRQLTAMAEAIEVDSKANVLLDFVDGILSDDPSEKVLVFTEYRDTLEYLRGLLEKRGWNPVIIHGGISMTERLEAEDRFRGPEANLMLATDAAGEGINLQFCHIMVNYELPWNPNRIDQRIGRLHRYGQKRDVKVHNLFVENTREGEIFVRLLAKIRVIEEQLGGSLSDITGILLEGVNLDELLINALADNVDLEVTWQDIEHAIQERQETYQRVENTMLMDLRKFDLESTLKVIERSEKLAASEKDIEAFVRAFFDHFGGRIERTRRMEVYRLTPPSEVVADGVQRQYDSVTFTKEVAKQLGEDVEFLAFGHPLLTGIIDFCRDRDYTFGGRATMKIAVHTEETPGAVFNLLLRYTDANGEPVSEDLLPVLVGTDGRVVAKPDLSGLRSVALEEQNAVDDALLERSSDIEKLYDQAFDEAQRVSQEYASKAQRKRQREVTIRRDDAERYFGVRIEERQARLLQYRERLEEGEDMEIAIRGVESEIRNLEAQRDRTLQRLSEDEVIVEEAPELLNVALVVPMESA
ncbi:MAG TPA: helicase-related protein [Anaerolineae bacterium]|nr:helicase-related protein [Anaerolineae bacterium]